MDGEYIKTKTIVAENTEAAAIDYKADVKQPVQCKNVEEDLIDWKQSYINVQKALEEKDKRYAKLLKEYEDTITAFQKMVEDKKADLSAAKQERKRAYTLELVKAAFTGSCFNASGNDTYDAVVEVAQKQADAVEKAGLLV